MAEFTELTKATGSFAAVGVTLLACGLLFYAWREKSSHPLEAVSGWLLLAAAAAIWTAIVGVEYGLVLSLTCPSLCALGIVLATRQKKSPQPAVKPIGAFWPGFRATLPRNAWQLVVQFPLAGFFALVLTSCAALALPTSLVNQLAFLIFLLPIIWGGCAVWLGADRIWYRPFISLSALNLLAALTYING